MTIDTTITTDIIHPTKKHNVSLYPQSKIPLHGLDVFTLPVGFSIFWFFDSPVNPITHKDVIDKLKCSLAEALELYPPVTGTVHCNKDDDWYIALDEPNRPGTPFHFEIKNTPYRKKYYKDLSPRTKEDEPLTSKSSILEVKATQFSCGTIAIATSFHHQVADLRSFLDFVEIWAALARGEHVDYKKIPKDWGRKPSQFFPPVQEESSIPPPWTSSSSPIPFEKMAERLFLPTQSVKLNISKDSVEQLKADFTLPIKNSNNSDQWISKGDAIISLISGALTRARESINVIRPWGRSNPDSQVEVISIACNCRVRRVPKGNVESHEYFGNLTKPSFATTQRADLLSPTINAASQVALGIRNNLNQELSQKNITNHLGYFGKSEVIKSFGRVYTYWDVLFSSWYQYDLQTTAYDFGWGKPFLGITGSLDSTPVPGICILMNGENTGDIYVNLGVEHSCVESFKSDSLLNKYATLCSTDD
ncbi:transferase family-domain-containing protein [Phascolomyces articulosus]|uniref:Transferase family-domain-containing protein n=1 Tax=Phascolomyces articulosus TaxID=60185 RepID=A0AAD5K2W1_9FUNG|nr:transferase family-domain-containing protein [Phascolomyces articulosus]